MAKFNIKGVDVIIDISSTPTNPPPPKPPPIRRINEDDGGSPLIRWIFNIITSKGKTK